MKRRFRGAVGEQDLVARPAEPALGRAATERVEPRAEAAAGGPAASAAATAEGSAEQIRDSAIRTCRLPPGWRDLGTR